MGWLTAAELVTKTRYSEAVQQQVAAALDAPAGADRDAACLAALTEAEKELRCNGKRPSEANMLKRLGAVKKRLKKAAVKLAAGRWRRISAALRRGMATLKLGHARWACAGRATREPLRPAFAVKVPIRGLVKGVWRDGTATVLTASFAYDRDDGERKEAPLLNAEEMMPIAVVDEPPDGADDAATAASRRSGVPRELHGNVCSVQHKEDVKLVRSGVSLRDCNIGIPGVAALLDLPAAAATVLEEELKPTEAGKILADMLPPKVLPCVVGHLIEKGAIPKTCAVAAFGEASAAARRRSSPFSGKVINKDIDEERLEIYSKIFKQPKPKQTYDFDCGELRGKDVVDSVGDAYDESKGRPAFGVVTNSCEPWTTCSEFYKDVPLALRPGVWHTPAIIQRLISRDSKGKLAGGLIENFAGVRPRRGYSNKRKRAIVVFYRAAPGVTPEITYL
ncbi:DnaJ molecular chaperone [Aureococcus anophagefferens]|uniref:DnaJ molecular chaperone n=1 Tax=Aureococcus anophagefferens TaxID=44056 RepID=A0ABR1FXA6_AURAN